MDLIGEYEAAEKADYLDPGAGKKDGEDGGGAGGGGSGGGA